MWRRKSFFRFSNRINFGGFYFCCYIKNRENCKKLLCIEQFFNFKKYFLLSRHHAALKAYAFMKDLKSNSKIIMFKSPFFFSLKEHCFYPDFSFTRIRLNLTDFLIEQKSTGKKKAIFWVVNFFLSDMVAFIVKYVLMKLGDILAKYSEMPLAHSPQELHTRLINSPLLNKCKHTSIKK